MKKVKDTSYIFMKKTKSELVVHTFMFVIFTLYALSLIVPLIWLLLQSFHDKSLYSITILENGSFAIPTVWHFENYIDAFGHMEHNGVNFFGMITNSLWYILIANTWCLFWPVTTGYLFAKYDCKGKKFLHALILFTLMVPVVGTTGATMKIIDKMGIYNKGPLFVILTGVSGFNSSFLIYYAIFKGLSWDYAESVFVDGGGNFMAYIYVMLPLALPAISAMMVQGVIGQWNEYYQFMMYMPSTPPVAMGLYFISLTIDRFGQPLYYAGLVISMIPVLIIYAFMAEKMMKNLTIGGLKG